MKTMFMALLFLVGCGATGVNPNIDPVIDPASVAIKARLAIFASYSCGICNHELPIIHRELREAFSLEEKLKYRVDVYVVGGKGGQKVTDEVAAQYVKDLGLTDFNSVPDHACRTHYKKYWFGCSVPATVLLAPDGSVIHNFGKGAIAPEELISAVKDAIK